MNIRLPKEVFLDLGLGLAGNWTEEQIAKFSRRKKKEMVACSKKSHKEWSFHWHWRRLVFISFHQHQGGQQQQPKSIFWGLWQSHLKDRIETKKLKELSFWVTHVVTWTTFNCLCDWNDHWQDEKFDDHILGLAPWIFTLVCHFSSEASGAYWSSSFERAR